MPPARRSALQPTDANAKVIHAPAHIAEKVHGKPAAEISGHVPDPKPTAKSAAKTGAKRKSDATTDDYATDPMPDDDLEGRPMDKSPQQVRQLINRLLESGAMTQTKFSDCIGVSPNGLRRFMQQHGMDKGAGCDAYQVGRSSLGYMTVCDSTQRWQEGSLGLLQKARTSRHPHAQKVHCKKQKTSASDSKDSKASNKSVSKDGAPDISSIHLDNEDRDAVPIHDTCSEIRRKITAHLKKPSVTAAQFCRDLTAQYHTERGPSNITSSHLQRFRGKKHAMEGCTSGVYYAAYVYFEKVRIAEGKSKSKHRQEMEKRWPNGTKTDVDWRVTGLMATAGSSIEENQYGEVSINGKQIPNH